MTQALLIIDVQNDYFPEGKMSLVGANLALDKINQLEEYFGAKQLPIIYIQHVKQIENADFFSAGTLGAELHPRLKFVSQSPVIEKHFPNSFFQTNLLETLEQLKVSQLVVTGMMTHMCVDSTTRAAKELGLQPILISDATATKDLELSGEKVAAEQVQLSFISALQNFSEIQTVEEFLKENE